MTKDERVQMWVRQQSSEVQALNAIYPINEMINYKGKRWWVCGYARSAEGDLVVQFIERDIFGGLIDIDSVTAQ